MEAAVLWHSKTGAVRNRASASIVVPSRLKPDGEHRRTHCQSERTLDVINFIVFLSPSDTSGPDLKVLKQLG